MYDIPNIVIWLLRHKDGRNRNGSLQISVNLHGRGMSDVVSDEEVLRLIRERLAKLEVEAGCNDQNEDDSDSDEFEDDDDFLNSKYGELGNELAELDEMQERERERQLVRSYLGQELAAVNARDTQDKERNYMLSRCYQYEGVGSKALPSQYHYKPGAAFDLRRAQNIHHTSSHYVMAGSKQFQRGVRVKGVVSRHSRQAALRNGVVLDGKGKLSKKARLRRKQSLARSEI